MDEAQDILDRHMLTLAARAAWRGMGLVEPNPMVGCVIGAPDGRVLGIGHHRRFGGPHAEIDALDACRRLGNPTRGATAWVTLEPCAHIGKTPPCADALVRAGIARVVIARRDPNPVSTGGVEKLTAAGIEVRQAPPHPLALRVGDPFVKRVTSGLPWVIVKWAQTLDGKVATRTGDSKWISCEASRRTVHRLRTRVDAIITGLGTVTADDPLLTPRGVAVRRRPLRCVLDSTLAISPESQLVRTAREAPLLVFTADDAPNQARAAALRSLGAEVRSVGADATGLSLPDVLRSLVAAPGCSTVLVEAGPRLAASFIAQGLADELLVFVAPRVLGDPGAPSIAAWGSPALIAQSRRLMLLRCSRTGEDACLCYAAPPPPKANGARAGPAA